MYVELFIPLFNAASGEFLEFLLMLFQKWNPHTVEGAPDEHHRDGEENT